MNERVDPGTPSSSTVLESHIDPTSARFEANMRFLADLVSQVRNEEERIREGGGPKAIESQHGKGRLTARERINLLIDPGTFFELGAYAAYGMYEEWGGAPSAGVVTGLAPRADPAGDDHRQRRHGEGRRVLPDDREEGDPRAEHRHRKPPSDVYLVDSAGVFLPLQDDVFPDKDDFGRIFRNNAVMSAMGIPQIAAIMGMCVAGGGYLPVMCDTC